MKDDPVRVQVLALLRGGNAHATFDQAVRDFPARSRGIKPDGFPHTAWQLLEHLRISQWDILEFCRNPRYVSPEWPDGYWPDTEAPASARMWSDSVAAFKRDLAAMEQLVKDPATDLYTPLAHGDGQNILREALLVADHNAYHLGQLVQLRRALGVWR